MLSPLRFVGRYGELGGRVQQLLSMTTLRPTCALFLGALAGMQNGDALQSVEMRRPQTYLTFGTTFQASVGLSRSEKWVELDWVYAEDGAFLSPDALLTQRIPTGFSPTAVEAVAGNKLAVAGKARNGDTRIEIWTVKKPLTSTQILGTELVPSVVLDPQGLVSIDEVYGDSVVGRDTVRAMFRLRGKPHSMLVQFADSGALYELQWGQEPFDLALSLDASSEPLLLGDYADWTSGDHSVSGYVYIFSNNDDWGASPLVLKDTNRDGVIDWHGAITVHDFFAAGLADAASYAEYAGRPPVPVR